MSALGIVLGMVLGMTLDTALGMALDTALKANTINTQKKRDSIWPLIVLINYFQHIISQRCIEQLCYRQDMGCGCR
ncbi:hypothetical protein AOR13_2248 [Alteromonas stellipolaris LMG 21856]|nr:hypothetical protein AOR13_2248 [Alteromonas stellipolaris LMG 21856]